MTAVPRLLASVEQPAMPAAVAERLQLAIARESATRTAAQPAGATGATARGVAASSIDAPDLDVTPAAEGHGGPDAGEARGISAGAGAGQPAHVPGRPDLPERSAGRLRTWPQLRWPGLSSPALLRGAAAVAVVAVLAGAGFLLARGAVSPQAKSSGAPTRQSGGSHRAASRQVPAGLAGSANLHYRLHGKIVTATALATHVNFTKARLASQVRREVANHPSFGISSPNPQRTAGSQNGKSAGPSLIGGVRIGTLNGCVSRVSAGRRVLLTEVARYLGRPATIIVLRSLTANILDVTVVGLACSASAPDYILRTTVPAG